MRPFGFEEPVTDPAALYQLRDGLMGADLLAAAVSHLNLFTWLADHPSTLGAICAHFQIQVRPADVMMTLCRALGLVTEAGGAFHLTARAREHLVEGSPWSMKPYFDTLKSRPQTREFLQVLQTGKPAHWGSSHSSDWAHSMESDAFADEFTAAMDCRGMLLAPALAKSLPLEEHRRVLDVAGGSGIYACALASVHPHLGVGVWEKAPVDRIARRWIEKRGFGAKVEVLQGDMFSDPWPPGFDVIVLSNVLHDWEDAVARELLCKASAALPSGGLLVVHDAFLNEAKSGPLWVAQYSALLMHSTEGRCFSLAEMRVWLDQAGLEWAGHAPTALGRSRILARKP